ncbi:hypothetical protein ACLMJK_007483 [Lecanora helva]
MQSRSDAYILLATVGILLGTSTVNAGSFNYSVCAEDSHEIFSRAPNGTFLFDQQGRPTSNFADAWGISYESCKRICGTEDNTGYYDWVFLSQGISSWLIPWLALTAQLPFETKNKTTNFMVLLLALGSPALATYSLATTILNARAINQKFRQIKDGSRALQRPLHTKAIKAARSILIEIQHVPIWIYNGQYGEISQLIVNPDNWAWWCLLRQKLLITKRKWTYSLYAQVGWVCVSQLLAIIEFFTTASSDSDTSIGIGLAINSLWLWMLPIVLGWVFVGTQNSTGSVTAALLDTNVPVFSGKKNCRGGCIGIKDRTYECFSTLPRNSLDTGTPVSDQSTQVPRQQSGASLEASAGEVTASNEGLDREQEQIDPAFDSMSPDLLSDPFKKSYFSKLDDSINMRTPKPERQISTASTLRVTEQDSLWSSEDNVLFDSLPQTFMGFSIAGDDMAPGPIFNYARVFTHRNAVKQIIEALMVFIQRQNRRQTVNGDQWTEDPDRWHENFEGTPQQMSQYVSASKNDLREFSLHAPASADLMFNCITAAIVSIFLQWGTTGAAIVIAYRFERTHRCPSILFAASAVLTRIIGKALAAANAVFIVATSVIHFTGLYDNCWCDACIPGLGKKAGWVVLFASESQIMTASRNSWIGGVFLAIVVGGIVSLWIFLARGDEEFDGDKL